MPDPQAPDTSRKVRMADPEDKSQIGASIPGMVSKISVKPGDQVEENQVVAVIEAMKMETSVVSRISGTVDQVLASAGGDFRRRAHGRPRGRDLHRAGPQREGGRAAHDHRMRLYFSGHDCRYAAEQSLLMLFPGEKPEYPEGSPSGERCELRVSRGAKYTVCTALLAHSSASTPPSRRRRRRGAWTRGTSASTWAYPSARRAAPIAASSASP